MMQKFEIQGVHMSVDDNTRKYVTRKIGRLDKYLPKAAKDSAHAEVQLKEVKSKNKNHSTCEVTLYLPKETINIKETTINMYAAIDIVETKLKQKIQKYKELHYGGKFRRRLVAKLRRKSARNSE
jgi:putative sigma-54 modulation protein